MRLFKYEGFKVTISPEAMTLKPFKDLWDRDKSKDKNDAINELSFIYFFVDPRSEYSYLTNDAIRMEEIKKGIGLPSKWKPDKMVMTAIDFYASFKPQSALLLEDAREMVNNLRVYMKNVDYEERDEKGKPIYTLNSVTDTIKRIPELVKALNEAQSIVDKDIIEQDKARGSVELTILDKDLDIWMEE